MTLPLWHIDAVAGGGVHPIAFITVESPEWVDLGRSNIVRQVEFR